MLSGYYSQLEKNIQETIDLCDKNSPIEKQFLIKIIDFVLRNSNNNQSIFTQNYILIFDNEFVNNDGEVVDLISYEGNCNPQNFIRIEYCGFQELKFNRFIEIKPQFKVYTKSDNKKYFLLDFGVFLYKKGGNQFEKELIKKFCIECDGYEFHSEKEHIIKDNIRNRKILEQDIHTIRYLGREINNLTDDDIFSLLDILFQEKKGVRYKLKKRP
jgi:hypothetical protein